MTLHDDDVFEVLAFLRRRLAERKRRARGALPNSPLDARVQEVKSLVDHFAKLARAIKARSPTA